MFRYLVSLRIKKIVHFICLFCTKQFMQKLYSIVHFLIVSGCLLYGIYKVTFYFFKKKKEQNLYFFIGKYGIVIRLIALSILNKRIIQIMFFYQDKSEFLLPYLVELVIILVQCLISIVNFILLKPSDEHSIEDDVVNDFFYDHPKQFSRDEKRFILGALIVTAIGMLFKNKINSCRFFRSNIIFYNNKNFLLIIFFINAVIVFFWFVILALYRRMRYAPCDKMANIENGIDTKTCA